MTQSHDVGSAFDYPGVSPRRLPPKRHKINPYVARSESSMHNDCYSSDVSDAVAPMGIYPEVTFLRTVDDSQTPSTPSLAPSTIYFDDLNNAYIAIKQSGVAIVDLAGERMTLRGSFVPLEHDVADNGIQADYIIQIAYSFIDDAGRVVGPTNHGHVVMVETRDADKKILTRFRKVLDVDVFALAAKAGYPPPEDGTQTLLSVAYDYSGNLWFTTGYFRVYPEGKKASNKTPAPGLFGYISRTGIDAILGGDALPEQYIHFYQLEPGEGAENGISSCPYGVAILTNIKCYMAQADKDGGVKVKWGKEYDSDGPKDAIPGEDVTGGGLAYGSGTTPTLTDTMVFFTDNRKQVCLCAFSAHRGKCVEPVPVFDDLPEGTQVSVENSILVYSGDASRVSVVICNWFGAGNPELASIDNPKISYDALYNKKWVQEGNKHLHPGIARVDFVDSDGPPGFEKKWQRADVRSTAIVRLSTATGILYSYDQDLAPASNPDTGMWRFTLTDLADGETLMEIPVGKPPEGYGMAAMNNMAVGVLIDPRGNALYCPTNTPYMARLRDRFVFVDGAPECVCDLDKAERHRLSDDEFKEGLGVSRAPASFLHTATVENIPEGADFELVFRVNGLEGDPADLELYRKDKAGTLTKVARGWRLLRDKGAPLEGSLSRSDLCELRLGIGGESGVAPVGGSVRVAVILMK